MELIVAVDQNWGIGHENNLLVRIPADLRRFAQLTAGGTVILGRKTLETFPNAAPLKGRRNLILSRNPDLTVEGAEVFGSVEALLAQCPLDAFVIGGEQIYRTLLPYCDTAHVTKLHAEFPADAFFPNLDTDTAWREVGHSQPMEHEGLRFTYVTYKRV